MNFYPSYIEYKNNKKYNKQNCRKFNTTFKKNIKKGSQYDHHLINVQFLIIYYIKDPIRIAKPNTPMNSTNIFLNEIIASF